MTEQLDFKASNIKCAGCVDNIEKGLTDFSGITEVKVELDGNIVVKGSGLDKASIESKLSELGYPLV